MEVELVKLDPNLFVFIFDRDYDMTMSFMRIQEFYECPNEVIADHHFTLERYMEYNADQNGNFEYLETVGGFNIPGDSFVEWIDLFQKKKDLSEKEHEIIDLLMPIDLVEMRHSYLIAVSKEDGIRKMRPFLLHEISHLMYHSSSPYRDSCQKLIDLMPRRVYKKAESALREADYPRRLFKDEMQAYFSTSGLLDFSETLRGRWGFKRNFSKFYIKFLADNSVNIENTTLEYVLK